MLKFISLSYLLFDPRRVTSGPGAPLSSAVWAARAVRAPGTAHDVFPNITGVGKGRNLVSRMRLPPHLFFCAPTPRLLTLHLSSPPSSKPRPSCAAVASNLSSSHLRSKGDLMQVRWLLGWRHSMMGGYGVVLFCSVAYNPKKSFSSPPTPSRVRTPDILLPHTTRELWSTGSSFDAECSCIGGDLRPPM
jgi:hypothetical protein